MVLCAAGQRNGSPQPRRTPPACRALLSAASRIGLRNATVQVAIHVHQLRVHRFMYACHAALRGAASLSASLHPLRLPDPLPEPSLSATSKRASCDAQALKACLSEGIHAKAVCASTAGVELRRMLSMSPSTC